MSEICYTTRERVKRALDSAETARNNREVAEAIAAATPEIESLCHRVFYPWTGTHYFDWPAEDPGRSWVLRLGEHDLISTTTITSGGVGIAPADYFLRPDDGPPYTRVEIDLDSSSSWGAVGTHQRAISIVGEWGYTAQTAPAGTLDVAVVNTTATSIAVTDGAAIGVGDIITIDSERMIVTEKTMLATGLTLAAPDLTASAANTAITMSGIVDTPVIDEIIQIGAEWMLVVGVSGTALVVRRAWDGTVLAAHTAGVGTGISAPRTLTVERGILGSTAATHLIAAPIIRHRPPPLVRKLAVALSMDTLLQEGAGYARISGSGESAREYWGKALDTLRERVYDAHGRKLRHRAV